MGAKLGKSGAIGRAVAIEESLRSTMNGAFVKRHKRLGGDLHIAMDGISLVAAEGARQLSNSRSTRTAMAEGKGYKLLDEAETVQDQRKEVRAKAQAKVSKHQSMLDKIKELQAEKRSEVQEKNALKLRLKE